MVSLLFHLRAASSSVSQSFSTLWDGGGGDQGGGVEGEIRGGGEIRVRLIEARYLFFEEKKENLHHVHTPLALNMT